MTGMRQPRSWPDLRSSEVVLGNPRDPLQSQKRGGLTRQYTFRDVNQTPAPRSETLFAAFHGFSKGSKALRLPCVAYCASFWTYLSEISGPTGNGDSQINVDPC